MISTPRGADPRLTVEDPRAARDLIVSVVVVMAVCAISFAAAGGDRKGGMSVLIAVPVAATVFSVRRYRDAAAARRELAAVSMVDSLTGLPNRRSLAGWYARAIEKASRTSSPVAVLFVDLDRFKSVNDTYGHDAGDCVLTTVAHRLRSAVQTRDRVVRYGGDEFVVLCNDTVTRPSSVRLAERISALVQEPIAIGGTQISVTASVGISIVDSEQCTMEQALSTADSAMDQAKSSGRGQCAVLDSGRVQYDDRESLIDELRVAVEQHQFVLHYQPVVSLADRSLVGVEALLRWQHPERGLLLPGLFVEELEESGLILPVGAWVLETACRQARAWQDNWPYRPFQVALNLSGVQLSDPDFSRLVIDTLRQTGVRPSRLCLEITEGAIIDDIDGAWATLRSAKERGVKLALDDFGTGFSSLSYLRRFKTDVLKIDRTFVAGLGRGQEDTAIVEHVIGLAHSLGMTTVAEGIEREDQYNELMRFGCDHAQGFWFSQAQTAEVINRLLDLTSAPADREGYDRDDSDLAFASTLDSNRGASFPPV
jgi:diguanylate cyclase (GGDEF)-like protein